MGRSKNPDVELKDLKPSDKAAANRLGVFDNNGKVFAFAQVRRGENALSYVVIAENHPEGAPLREFLETSKPYSEDPLRNVREAFQKAGAEGQVEIRSCCNFSKNVAVLLVGKRGKEWSTVTLLDRFVEAQFKGKPTPTTPVETLIISTKPDEPDEPDKRAE